MPKTSANDSHTSPLDYLRQFQSKNFQGIHAPVEQLRLVQSKKSYQYSLAWVVVQVSQKHWKKLLLRQERYMSPLIPSKLNTSTVYANGFGIRKINRQLVIGTCSKQVNFHTVAKWLNPQKEVPIQALFHASLTNSRDSIFYDIMSFLWVERYQKQTPLLN